jgi:phosphatidylglycerophosphate synthase
MEKRYDFFSIRDELYAMQKAHDLKEGRKYNRSAFGNIPRLISRPLTVLFVMLGIRARYITLLHSALEMAFPVCVFLGKPVLGISLWFTGFILDHCDGDVARVMKDTGDLWDDVDQIAHAWLITALWLAAGFVHDLLPLSAVILGLWILTKEFRFRLKREQTYSEKTWVWRLVTRPVNVNFLVVGYFIISPFFAREFFIFYIVYLLGITGGQYIKLVRNAWI